LEEQEQKRVTFTYGLVTVRTRRANALMDRLGKLRIVRPLSWFLLVLMPIAAGLIFYLLLYELTILTSPRGAAIAGTIRVIGPRINFLLPGLNPYIPVVYGVIAIAVALTIHEFSHGVVARSLGMPVKSAGLLFLLFVPIGAFVEVDEKVVRETKPRNALRMLGAGPGINMLVGIACLVLLIFSVSAMTPAANGAAIQCSDNCSGSSFPSPAYQAGVMPGDFIVAINSIPVNNIDYALRQSGDFQPGQVVNVTIWRDGQISTLQNLKLGNITYTYTNIVTNASQTISYPYLGVVTVSLANLKGNVSAYSSAYRGDPLLYMLPPSFPGVAAHIPFSDLLIGFYNTPLGPASSVIDNLLFWLFFVNFNLGLFNCLPLYPLDGGQAFERFLVGAGGGRISDSLASRITTIVTLTVVALLFVTLAGPYLGLF
jgi:membrane-associated protease RseP (regulator of RpoE activity)